MPKFRTISGQFVGYVPDGTDPDINPDRETMNGRVTFTPVFTGGVIAFPELSPPEFAHPEPISARIIDGFVQVQVGTDDDVSMQPLSLMVTVDDEASQVWSWRAEFTNMRIGTGEVEVTIPSWSFRVPDGTGPVDLTELVPLKTSATVDVTKGPRGAGLQTITAQDGQLVFEYTDGEQATIPVPEAVQGPEGPQGPAGADGAEGPQGEKGDPGEIPDLLVGNITDATPTGKNLMLAATEGAARNALGLSSGATAANGSLEELNTGTSSAPRVWNANNIASYVNSKTENLPTLDVATPEHNGLMASEDKAFLNESLKKTTDESEYTHTFVDSEGRIGLGIRTTGQIDGVGIGKPVPDTDPYPWSVRDSEGRVSELAIDQAGKIPDWVLDRLENRRGWGSTPDETAMIAPVDVWRRTLLVDEFKRRRGQVIGTAGKAAIALRFDHGLAKFKDQILPLLDAYDLPSVQAFNPRNLGNTQNSGVTWDDCKNWWANYGVEFSNHTATHASSGDAGTPAGRANARDEIVNGLSELAGALGGEFPIELFTPPGGVTVGEKALFDGGKTAANFYGTYWGQLILQNHAAVHGYIGGQLRPLPADNDIGLTIVGMDSSNAATLTGWVDQAVAAKAGVQFMFHPDELGKSGIISIEDVETFFAHIATLRNSGVLEVLTPTGLQLADPNTDYRHDLLPTWGESFTGWTGTSGWTSTTGPEPGVWAQTTTGGVMSTTIPTSPNHRHYRGGNRVLTYQVIAPEGAVVQTTVNGSSGVLSRTRQHTIASGTEPVTVRHHCALPMVSSPTLTIRVGRVSGGPVTISAPKLITV